MKKASTWQKISGKVIHSNPWFVVIKDKVIKPNGQKGEYYYLDLTPSVFIVALTDNHEVILIKQYRYPIKKWNIEIPAGNSEGQVLLQAAKRELKEETGLTAKKWQKIGELEPFNGVISETMHVYLATILSDTHQHEQTDEGIVEMIKIPLSEALEWTMNGKIRDCQTIASLYLADSFLKK